MRFSGHTNEWQTKRIDTLFEFVPNNSISRDGLNYDGGVWKNIHYGDILTVFPTVLDIRDVHVPYISSPTFSSQSSLSTGDVVIADTAEDYTAGKALEVGISEGIKVVPGLHTIACHPKVSFAPGFLGYYLNSSAYKERLRPLIQGIKVYSISKSSLATTSISFPSHDEQYKIGLFLSIIDRRIAIQNKIIEELKTLELSLIDEVFSGVQNATVGEFAYEVSERNRDEAVESVYSVSNKSGFVPQNEQFEDKEVASTNKSNYKVVRSKTFAYNPARINVGSIGYFEGDEPVIISPMYVCFRVRGIEEGLLKQFFLSNAFYRQMQSRLEGSVRQCLTFDGMRTIKIHVPNRSDMKLLNLADLFRKKKEKESRILEKFLAQKSALLLQMFI